MIDRNQLAAILVEKSGMGDNLIIVLISYFESHGECPDEEENDNGWRPWAVSKAYEAIDIIIAEVSQK